MNKAVRVRVIILLCAVAAAGALFFLKFEKGILNGSRNAMQMQPAFKQGTENKNTDASTQPSDASGRNVAANNPIMATGVDETASAESEAPALVEYKGNIRHIFFHPLIIYPEMAFDGDSTAQGYNDWFVTVGEFKKILDSLYENNYILVDMTKLYEVAQQDGKNNIKKKKLLLPEGKKPLVLSVDDMNYYDYMKENGNAHKLVIDGDGNAAAYYMTPDGQEKTECDNEIVPILDRFVAQHPDFSLEGAKGILALTGYAGILGYHTEDKDAEDYEKEKEEALKVVKRLKETGWTFACHGYGHLHSNKVSFDRLKSDTAKWKAEVEPLVGPTGVYVYPYGEEIPIKNPKFEMLKSEGFSIFCPVGSTGFQIAAREYVQMDRMNIDGTAFYYRKEKLSDMFDVDSVIDAMRPAMK